MTPLRPAALAVVAALAAPVLAGAPAEARPLHRGSKGPPVERLQRALHLTPAPPARCAGSSGATTCPPTGSPAPRPGG